MDPPERRRLTSPIEKEDDDPPMITYQPGVDHIHLDVPETNAYLARQMKKSPSSASIQVIRAKIREKREKFKKNQCAGIITFLILGTLLNVMAYLTSVWAAYLQQEVVRSAVENEHTFRFKLKRTLAEAPSKYLIGLLNFAGRVMSALGIVLLVQVVTQYLKRRRYSMLARSAVEEADTVIGDMHGGITDTVGECCTSFFQMTFDTAPPPYNGTISSTSSPPLYLESQLTNGIFYIKPPPKYSPEWNSQEDLTIFMEIVGIRQRRPGRSFALARFTAWSYNEATVSNKNNLNNRLIG